MRTIRNMLDELGYSSGDHDSDIRQALQFALYTKHEGSACSLLAVRLVRAEAEVRSLRAAMEKSK